MNNKILTIVIPTFNSENHITACLDSVRAQARSDVEVILIDGSSSDKTMSIVENYKDCLSLIISEPDKGQSDAFNKGFTRAHGRYLTWLNSDDILTPGVLKLAVQYLYNCKSDWVAANCAYLDAEGRVLRFCGAGSYENFAVKRGILNVFGPSTFFTQKVYNEVGPINPGFHYCMDTEYWWRIIKHGYKFSRMPYYFWAQRLHLDAKTASVIISNTIPEKMITERQKIRKTYSPHRPQLLHKIDSVLVKAYRTINLSYMKSMLNTFKYRRHDALTLNLYE